LHCPQEASTVRTFLAESILPVFDWALTDVPINKNNKTGKNNFIQNNLITG
jgi:hypothetical protein